jgi:Flp pilus assembly protein TadG
VLVESAFVFPVLVLLVFGILEYGLAFLNASSVTSASRTGVRSMAAASKQPGYQTLVIEAVRTDLATLRSSTPLEIWIYKAIPAGTTGAGRPLNGDGTWNPSGCPAASCERYTFSTATGTWTKVSGNFPSSAQNACFVGAGPGTPAQYPDTVGVFVRARYDFATRLFGQSLTLEDYTAMRLEPVPTASGCAAS